MASPTFVDVGSPGTKGLSATSAVITFNTAGDFDVVGEATNDVAVVVLYKESTSAVTAPASGIWNLVGTFDQDTGGFRYRAYVYWAYLTTSLTTETWSWTGAAWRYAEVWVGR